MILKVGEIESLGVPPLILLVRIIKFVPHLLIIDVPCPLWCECVYN